MSSNPSAIPKSYSHFRDLLMSFAEMIQESKDMPLELDYLFIAEQSSVLPKANVSFFSSAKYGVFKFFMSFFSNYNDLTQQNDTTKPQKITVWIGNGLTGGRDQANVLSQLITQEFTPKSNINVNLQLIAPSTILTATVAGKGPDVALQISGSDPANYAMRHAIVDLSQLNDFNTVKNRFSQSALVPYTYNNGVYALPETLSFPVMFYRKDILNEMGINIDSIKTWNDLIGVLPVIQRKNMNIAIPATFNSYTMFLYQMNGSLYKNSGKTSNLDDQTSLNAFKCLLKFYTNYSMPYSYNFVTRFRTGEIPIAIDDYTQYNLLQISAPEIRGLWGMKELPGILNENGESNNIAPASGAGCVLMSACKRKKDAWNFMVWWTSSDIQYKFGQELESVMGVGARYNTANLEALNMLSWKSDDKNTLFGQINNLKGIPEVPGGYLTSRNIGFAIQSVYTTNSDARKTLLSYVDQINQEISIKRKEFGLD